jgi:parallel beta-helix repeat protein
MAALSTYPFWLPLDDSMVIPRGHGVIEIDGNADFAATALQKGWPGDGTPENPYIIDGLDIDRGGEAGYCIYIKNTRVSFIMRNCRFTGAHEGPAGEYGSHLMLTDFLARSGAGILLFNVANGELVNNTCNSNNNMGIFLLYSHLNTVANNTCNNNTCSGISVECSSHNNTVANNTCNNNGDSGIALGADSNTVVNNICSSNGRWRFAGGGGIAIGGAYNTVANNTCSGNNYIGISLRDSTSNILANNTCNNNWYGIWDYMSDLHTVVNNTCNNNSRGISLGGDSSTMANNTCFFNHIGIEIHGAKYNTLANNTCNSNDIGITIEPEAYIHQDSGEVEWHIQWIESRYNTVTNNICNENKVGIGLNGSSYNNVENNTCNSNDIGIFLDRIVGPTQFGLNQTPIRPSWIDSHSNTVADNTCNYNRIGIYLRNSTSNTVVNNTFLGNTEHDILEESGTEEIPPDIFSCSDSQELHFWVQDREYCQE